MLINWYNLFMRKLKISAKNSTSISEMIRKLGLNPRNGTHFSKVKNAIHAQNIDITHFRNGCLKYNKNVNHKVFEKITTKPAAYWAGFIAADGYVARNFVRIELGKKDEEQIDNFIKFVNGDSDSKRYRTGKLGQHSVSVSIHSKKIYRNLCSLGLQSPKSKKNLYPGFRKKELKLAYLLGFYDGDGNEYSPELSCGSQAFLRRLKRDFKIKSTIREYKNRLGRVFSLYVGYGFIRTLLSNYKGSMKRKRVFLDGVAACWCGSKIFSRSASVCSKHARSRSPEYDRKLKIMLNEYIKKVSLLSISSELGISRTEVVRRCKRLGIKVPSFPHGYWLSNKKRKDSLRSLPSLKMRIKEYCL